MDAAPEVMRISESRMREEMDDRADGMSRGNSSKACLSCGSAGVRGRKRGNIGRRERTCAAIDGKMGGRFSCSFIYSYLYC